MTNPAHPSQNQAPQAPTPQPAQQSAAMTLASDQQFRLALEPTTFGETMQACELVASIGFGGCTTPAAALVRVMLGRSFGMGFIQSINSIYDIEGKAALDANAMVALCLQSPICEYFVCTHTDASRATYKTKRRNSPEPQELTFTVQEAEAAGLMDRGATPEKKAKSNWNRWTADMLRARASSKLARMVYPDVVRGLHSREELYDVRYENEMVGEVVQSVPQAPVRDFATEAKALLAKIETITPETPQAARRAIREECIQWDGVEPYRSTVLRAYNDLPPAARPAKAAPPTAPSQTQATLPTESKPAREPGVD